MKKTNKVLNVVFIVLIFLLGIYILNLRKTIEYKQQAIDECLYAWSDFIDSTEIVIATYKDSINEFKKENR